MFWEKLVENILNGRDGMYNNLEIGKRLFCLRKWKKIIVFGGDYMLGRMVKDEGVIIGSSSIM